MIEKDLCVEYSESKTLLFSDYLAQFTNEALNTSNNSTSLTTGSKLTGLLSRFSRTIAQGPGLEGSNIYIGVPLKKLGAFDYRYKPSSRNWTHTALSQTAIPLESLSFGLMSSIEESVYSWYTFELLDKLPSILKLFERAVQAAEAKQYFKLSWIDITLFYKSISPTMADPLCNMTSLAIMGEVVLKAVHGIDQIVCHPNANATTLTNSKCTLLNVQRVASLPSLVPGLNFFLSPVPSVPSIRQLYASALALLASSFLTSNQMRHALQTADALGIYRVLGFHLWKEDWISPFQTPNLKSKSLAKKRDVLSGDLIGANSILWGRRDSERTIMTPKSSSDSSMQARTRTQSKSLPTSRKGEDFGVMGKLEFLQQRILNYKFKDQVLLNTVLSPSSNNKTMQKMEYLGDIVVELVTLMMARKIQLLKGKEMTPDLYSGIKIIVLSTEGLSSLFVFHKLHEFIPVYSFSQHTRAAIDLYIAERDFSEKCRYLWWRTKQRAPKILADTLEAIFGAVFYDGGWTALVKVVETIAGPMIQYATEHFDAMGKNIIGDIIAHHRQKGKQNLHRRRM